MIFDKFTGINNVTPADRLKPSELVQADNVDIGVTSEIRRRGGYATMAAGSHANVWDAEGFTLGTRGINGDLVNLTSNITLYPSLGNTRVWYCNLPDGRTAFSNGLINGIVSAAARTGWGVPLPASVGAGADVAGQLHPGDYQYSLTYVRTADGLEGAPAYADPVSITSGGIVLSALPQLAGHSINVYLTSHNGGKAYLAGNTTGTMFSFTGKNSQLQQPCATDFMGPAPVGTVSAIWRGRALVAVGKTLYASRYGQVELFDLLRDYKQFSADITTIVPMDSGIYVGTREGLYFLAGTEFDKLVADIAHAGEVVLGSGVVVDGTRVQAQRKDGVSTGSAMVCIVDGWLVLGYEGGALSKLTQGRYRTTAKEVWAMFREVDGVPQYVAQIIPELL